MDAQNEYATGTLRISHVETSRKVIAAVLEKYRAAKAPVIHVVHATPEGAPVFTPGTELAEEFAELKPAEGESVVTKQFPGSFTGTELQTLLEGTGRKKVVLTGYMVCALVFSHTGPRASSGGGVSRKVQFTNLYTGPRVCFHDGAPGCGEGVGCHCC
ncbi:MAG: isochorismatase family protein [Candidatus Binatia bacterium]